MRESEFVRRSYEQEKFRNLGIYRVSIFGNLHFYPSYYFGKITVAFYCSSTVDPSSRVDQSPLVLTSSPATFPTAIGGGATKVLKSSASPFDCWLFHGGARPERFGKLCGGRRRLSRPRRSGAPPPVAWVLGEGSIEGGPAGRFAAEERQSETPNF